MADDTYIDTSGGSHINGNVDVKRDFAGRDINYNYFTGRYAKLAQLYRTPQHIFDDVDVQGFVGRENVKRAIDTFIDDNPRGAFIIEGEAGLGKTSLMAHLVYTRGYAHIFGQEFTGLDGRVEAARSLAAQLISQYQLEGYGDSIDIDQAASSTFLTNVLNQASGKLREGGPFGDKIVIVCDALDQAAPPANDQNVFGLPKRLPNGVYLIVTQRPVQVAFECEPSELFALRADDENNQRDIRAYLSEQAQQPKIVGQLQAHQPPYSAAHFVDTLVDKSAGNWMYLRYVLHEVRRGNYHPFEMDALPQGLTSYYLAYWRKWTVGGPTVGGPTGLGDGKQAWRDVYGPLLGLLAAAQQPLTARQLLEWSRLGAVTDEPTLRRLLTVDWAAYVTHAQDDTFTFYHPSLLRLMRGETEPGEAAKLRREEGELVRQFKANTAEAHARIVAFFGAQCGNDWVKLAANGYVRRFIVTHLREVEPEAMYALVAMSDAWAKAREKHDDGYAGYLADLNLAWGWAERDEWKGLGRQLRCALIESSIRTLAKGVSKELLRQLLQAGIWSAARTLDMALHVADDHAKAQRLIEIFPYLPTSLRAEALQAPRPYSRRYRRQWRFRVSLPRRVH